MGSCIWCIVYFSTGSRCKRTASRSCMHRVVEVPCNSKKGNRSNRWPHRLTLSLISSPSGSIRVHHIALCLSLFFLCLSFPLCPLCLCVSTLHLKNVCTTWVQKSNFLAVGCGLNDCSCNASDFVVLVLSEAVLSEAVLVLDGCLNCDDADRRSRRFE